MWVEAELDCPECPDKNNKAVWFCRAEMARTAVSQRLDLWGQRWYLTNKIQMWFGLKGTATLQANDWEHSAGIKSMSPYCFSCYASAVPFTATGLIMLWLICKEWLKNTVTFTLCNNINKQFFYLKGSCSAAEKQFIASLVKNTVFESAQTHSGSDTTVVQSWTKISALLLLCYQSASELSCIKYYFFQMKILKDWIVGSVW